MEFASSIPGGVLEISKFLSALSTPVGHPSFQINDYQKKKSGPGRRADNSAVLGVPNVKARIETQHSISILSLHDLLWENFTLP
jgi:hypothetical protein